MAVIGAASAIKIKNKNKKQIGKKIIVNNNPPFPPDFNIRQAFTFKNSKLVSKFVV